MNLSKILLSISFLSISLYSANVNVTTKYGKTGGIVGVLNTTTQVVNGRTICPVNPTVGCDFGDDPLFSNNGTTADPSDDSYSGDLIVRTNDSFQAVAGWTWNGIAGGTEEKVTIVGTLPSTGKLPDGSTGTTKSYKWDTLPGSCDATESSISADKQTMVCVRKNFDKNDVGTYSEDLPFNVIVKGETLSGTEPGDITFEVSSENAPTVSDDTDGYSLTVTAAPRWNLQKSMYTYITGQEIDGVKGWIMDYKFYIEVDEVDGEIDNASALVGNESMGKNATFTFKDDISEVSPNAKLIDCSMEGRYTNRDGYVGSTDPITFNGAGSIYGDGVNSDRKIPQARGEQTITCSQSGTTIDLSVKGVDATLTNYPKLDYAGHALPVNRGIAAIGSIYIFVPLDDVKPQSQGGNNPEEEGWLTTKNHLTNFDPVTPTGHANFGGERESELDNHKNYTLYYSRGSFDKYYRGDKQGVWIYPGGALGYRSGDGMVTQGYEFSTALITNNTGGTPFAQEKVCDVVDAYRLEIQDIGDNVQYNIIKTYYRDAYHINSRPIMYRIWNGEGNYTNGLAEEPYIFEYASTYENDSWLPSRGGDQTISHKAEIETECNADDAKWYATVDEARQNGLGTVTKVRIKLRNGVEHNPGAYVYWWLNHKVRSTDLKTGQLLENGDEITNFSAYSFNGNPFTGATYKTMNFPAPAEGTLGDRMTFTGAKVRVIKSVDKVALSAGDIATFTLKVSFTNDTGLEEYGDVTVTDLLPKGLKYVEKSVTAPYSEPVIGTCADVADINTADTPCNDSENQVLIWNLGERRANEIFPDINYSTIIGVEVNAGTVRNVVKIEAPTDASPISQRKSEVGMSITIPASINIIKSTEENPDYPSLRERTTVAKTIDFVMNMRNGKAGEITDLDVIDILPFVGDADDGAIKFNNLELNRKVATNYHGTSIFATMELIEHPLSSSLCDLTANGGVSYYYTNADPKTINIAPTVGDANIIGGANTIWCEGDENGPNGCNELSNADVTAVRARGPRMEAQAICQLKMSLSVKDNLAGDNYSNSTGSSATGITLPVLSNSLAVPIVGSSLGDYVWYDRNGNGVQDGDEHGMAGVTVRLLDGSGTPVKNPASPSDDYVVTTAADGKYSFTKLNSGSYIVQFVQPIGYTVSDKSLGGNSALDSDVNRNSLQTDVIALGVDEKDLTIDAGFYTPIISGHIFDDGNSDGTVNGTAISAPDGTPLYVTLLDENNNILASKSVSADGSYSFDGEDNVTADKNYRVVLSTALNVTSSTLPQNWNSADGEHVGTDAGLDNAIDGSITVSVAQADVPEVNFGINKKPEASDVTKVAQFNPEGTVQVDVPPLNIIDEEDGTPIMVTIKTLPNSGKLYYNGVEVVAGQVMPNFDSTKLTVDPDSGEVTVQFTYTATDKVGVESDPATVTMPFKDLKISGHLFVDGNGDGNVNGTATSVADGVQLYATLVKDGTAIASKPLSGGAYAFDIKDGVKTNSNYSVVLSETNGSTVASLPDGWDNNDGENINSNGAGNDGSKDGVLVVNVVESDVTQADFGINKKPEANNVTEAEQVNPGTSSSVQVPDLNISDSQSNSLDVNFTSVPTNATLYYNGAVVHAGDIIENFDNTLLTIDPDSGDQNVSFEYSVRDEAGVVSEIATVSMSFKNIIISGKLFNDGNGNGNVDGTSISKADDKQLYVTLVDSRGTLVSSKALDGNGTYYFESADGLSPDADYTVVLTDALNKTTASLPATWNNADGENIGLVGLDGEANGLIAVNLLQENISEINFGINKKPTAEDKTEEVQFNPGSTTEVVVPDLNVSDREDGNPTLVNVTLLPTNGTLYYNGVAVVLDANITDVNVSNFTFDPNDGDLTALFKYTTTDRAGVVSDEATVTMPFVGLQITGHIFNDGDNDGTINGTGISAPNGTQLYVTLVDENGTAVASHEVNADGSYAFKGVDGLVANSNYKVVLSTEQNSTTANLPVNWSNLDGEHIGVDAGTDGNNDGTIEVPLLTSNIVEVNFGINKKPVAGDHTEPLQLNPGTDIRVTVPDLNITDTEDNRPAIVTIQTVPTYGTLYYNGVAVTAGQVINNFDNSLLTIDPDNGDVTVSFTYTTTDAVGVESDVATVSMLFDGLEIRGNIFNDGNNNGGVDGTKISVINGTTPLYVTLLDDAGSMMASKPIDADGTYKFTGVDGIVPNTNYSVVLTTELNGTVATLPSNWNNADGEHIGSNVGLDGDANGKIGVEVSTIDVVEVNFGINEQPQAVNKEEPLQVNPGKDTQVVVPTLEISDNEDGTPKVIAITTLPTNGTLYYNGTPVALNSNILDANLSNFTVDPDNGDVNVTFTYTSTDTTGWRSEPATVVMPFDGLRVSGQIFMDGNSNSSVDGVALTSNQNLELYVNLVDSDGSVVAWVPLNSDGSYEFNATTGIVPDSNYSVVLSQNENSTAATLPSNWKYSDSDTQGTLVVSVESLDVTEVNFGVNKQPVVTNVSVETVVNPDTDHRVQVPNLNILGNEDGTLPTIVTLTNLPSNGTLYYNGVAVTEGQVIYNFNNSLLTVDPDDGDVVVVFSYTTTDDAGFESRSARVTIPFSDPDTDGDGITNSKDLDDDNDGILDTIENATALNGGDSDGDGIPDRLDLDSDGDGILDLEESNPNAKTLDSNGDGRVDSTTDTDKDGVMESVDADDNNPTSEGSVVVVDTDSDGQPDFQDVDSDNDGLSDLVESGTDATKDSNSDGILDNLTDSDGDGIADVVDSDNGGTPATTPDIDEDGVDNYRDLDSDGDGLFDVVEINGTDNKGDGHIEPVGTLVDGTNLPDENGNGIPDVFEMKLKDDVKSVTAGEVGTMNLLENDSGDIDPDSVKLLIPTNFDGVARISPDGKTLVVDGEGEWSVDKDGVVTFKPESGFNGSPTPIMYQATTKDGSKTSVATITFKVTNVAGVSDESCPDYVDKSASVPTLGLYGLILMVIFGSIFGASLMRREE